MFPGAGFVEGWEAGSVVEEVIWKSLEGISGVGDTPREGQAKVRGTLKPT